MSSTVPHVYAEQDRCHVDLLQPLLSKIFLNYLHEFSIPKAFFENEMQNNIKFFCNL
jgi:hypothetical protein